MEIEAHPAATYPSTMKLLLCRTCGDVVEIRPAPHRCHCGATTARPLDDVRYVDGEPAIEKGASTK